LNSDAFVIENGEGVAGKRHYFREPVTVSAGALCSLSVCWTGDEQ
jgi:hypothetical protein